jgi:alkylation response protein AidB-like acyl-CoA dehydrogenase
MARRPPQGRAAADDHHDHQVDGRWEALLARTRTLAAEVLAPRAQRTDQDERLAADIVQAVAGAGLWALAVPAVYGGLEAPIAVIMACSEILAGACGVTEFIVARQMVACMQIARSPNEALKAEVFPRIVRGERLCARGTTHVRSSGPPVLRAARDGDGWVLDGTAPWATGLGIMHDVLLSGTAPDGRTVTVMVPFEAGPCLEPSPSMRLCALQATATVSLAIRGLRVGPERVLGIDDPAEMARLEPYLALHRVAQPFGATAAALALLHAHAARGEASAAAAAAALGTELTAARREALEWAPRLQDPAYPERALRLAAWAHDLSVRATFTAAVASGGRANQRDHPAQRLYREALLHSVYLQTLGVKDALLERLVAGAASSTSDLPAPSRSTRKGKP